MTTINSICIKCEKLIDYDTVCIPTGGCPEIISTCMELCGKNSGNRKTCKLFEPCDEEKTKRRIALLERYETK